VNLEKTSGLEWSVLLFLILTPVLGILGTVWVVQTGSLNWSILIFALVYAGLANFGITAGYHRLFAHRAYQAHPVVEFLFLMLGTSAFQGSALKWSSDHRRHHRFEDTDSDPYAIKFGFWHAHMGWMIRKEFVDLPVFAPDLEKNRLLNWQHRNYFWIGMVVGFLLPALVGWGLGSFWAGLFVAGALRTVVNQQSGFIINSFSHMFGHRTYSTGITARDNFILAVLTHGEGYHNFHHTFQLDYRNGVKWYHWDPTKWTIWCLAKIGLAGQLRRISQAEIIKAQLATEALSLKAQGFSIELLEKLQSGLIQQQLRLKALRDESALLKTQLAEASNRKLSETRAEIKRTQDEFRQSMRQWRREVDRLMRQPTHA